MGFDSLLEQAVKQGASDVHLKLGRPPLLRIDGSISALSGPPLSEADLDAFVGALTASAPMRREQFLRTGDLDTAYSAPGLPRFRVNVFRQRGAVSMVLRIIPRNVPRFSDLGLPRAVERLAEEHRGLVLVTGATGSGKTTTLAAMLDHINRSRASHIVTIEDPIEVLHDDHQSIVNQREVGLDTESFSEALRRALRQDPDTIMIGELRDSETAQTALQASESGHLVFSTMHTLDAAETISRMIEFFPEAKQQQIRSIMAGVLRGVISQRLLPSLSGGRVAVVEAMVVNARIAELIRAGKPDEIPDAMAEGDYFDMQTFEQALIDRVVAGVLASDIAADAATNRHDFMVALERELKRRGAAEAEQAHELRHTPSEPEPEPVGLRVAGPSAA